MCKIESANFIAFHPGYYVAEVIADLKMSHSDFAKRLGVTPKHLCEILKAKTSVNNNLAHKLSAILGTSVDVWLNLQKNYNEKLLEIDAF